MEVIALTVDVGTERDLESIRQKALQVGAVKALVARTCGCDIASEDLRGKVLARIRAVQIEITRTDTR